VNATTPSKPAATKIARHRSAILAGAFLDFLSDGNKCSASLGSFKTQSSKQDLQRSI
jgi:hypothetical protein